jgi:deazaflavin-dependent oxidoreductase (nitroreductase family)
MPTKVKAVQKPRGLWRWLHRLPIWLFRMHLGWLAGSRFMLLTHTGRKSGLPRQTILEVMRADKESDTYCVFVGFGEGSDWVRNVEKTPDVEIDVGGKHFRAHAQRLGPDESARIFMEYARKYPIAQRVLPRLMGYRVDGSAEDFAALARLGTVIAFQRV